MKKLSLLIAAGVGYVLGTKAGRERYDQIRGAVKKVADDPRVQEKAHQAADLARDKIPGQSSGPTAPTPGAATGTATGTTTGAHTA